MTQRRQYKNPPIEEAVCELRLKSAGEWDAMIPGRLADLLSNGYPAKPKQQVEMSPTIQPGGSTALQGAVKVRFLSQDEKRLVMVGNNGMSIHDLRPYSGWEKFRARISEAIDAYLQVNPNFNIDRISLRYINKLEVGADWASLSDYIRGLPAQVPEIPTKLVNFFYRYECDYPDSPVRAVITFGHGEAVEQKRIVLLDVDVLKNMGEPMTIVDSNDVEKFLLTIDELRIRERNIFEALITDKTREIFDAT